MSIGCKVSCLCNSNVNRCLFIVMLNVEVAHPMCVCSRAHRMVVDRVARRLVAKAGLRKGFSSWQQVTSNTVASNLKAHRVTSKMLRYRYALIFRLWHVVAADLARHHRLCLRALSAMYRRRVTDCFDRWASVAYHTAEESRRHIR